jgi:hypothetical protein
MKGTAAKHWLKQGDVIIVAIGITIIVVAAVDFVVFFQLFVTKID